MSFVLFHAKFGDGLAIISVWRNGVTRYKSFQLEGQLTNCKTLVFLKGRQWQQRGNIIPYVS